MAGLQQAPTKTPIAKAVVLEGDAPAPAPKASLEPAPPVKEPVKPGIVHEGSRAEGGLTRWKIRAEGHMNRYILAKSQDQAEKIYREAIGVSEADRLVITKLPD